MKLATIDWVIILGMMVVYVIIGRVVAKRSSKSVDDFFLSGRNMPWWILGISMVATTFAADTPGLITDFIRSKGGVYFNWVWWSMLLTGMLTVFFYARLWRRLNVTTDLEFYELRYSGKAASVLRGFRAVYLGLIFNVITMAGVCLAGVKIGQVLLGLSPVETLTYASVITVIYSALGGLRGVLITDVVQFTLAMIGSVWSTIYIIRMPEIGGLDNLFAQTEVASRMAILPDLTNPEVYIPVLLVPLAVQWWSTWYPGAEPGGGGYIAQRMLAAKDENHATWATLFFNFAHYALRPWPWILVGLASLVLYPDLVSLATAYPEMDPGLVKDDMAYPAMLAFLPAGLLGLVITSLIAAFMSTLSTQLNWGSSYIVNDFYKRFVNQDATQRQQVVLGRVFTVILMVLASLLALNMQEAKKVFELMLQIGAGTGLLFILRWFWNRINPYSEIAAMVISFLIAVVFYINDFGLKDYEKLLIGVGVTTVGWLIVTYLTRPVDSETLQQFEQRAFGGADKKYEGFRYKILGFFLGTIGVYSALFCIGYWIYQEPTYTLISATVFALCCMTMLLMKDKIFGSSGTDSTLNLDQNTAS